MDLRRLRAGEWIFGIAGVVLAIALFLPWWGLEGRWIGFGPGGPIEAPVEEGETAVTTWTAWQVFSVADLLLLALALLAIATWAIVARAPTPGPGIAAEALVTLLAIPMTIVALVQVLGTPGVLDVPASLPGATVEVGAWLGLFATCAILFGLIGAMRDERLSRPGRPTDQAGAPLTDPLPVERLPAPPAA